MAQTPFFGTHLLVNGNMASNITSPVQTLNAQDNVGIQLNWTGTPTGTFSFQISADYKQDQEGNVINPGNWISLPVSPSISASGSASQAYVDLNQMSSEWVRVVYTAASGTGTLNIYTSGKGI